MSYEILQIKYGKPVVVGSYETYEQMVDAIQVGQSFRVVV